MQAYFLRGKSCLFMLLVLPSLIITGLEEDWGGIATLGVGVARVKRRRQERRRGERFSLSLSPSFLPLTQPNSLAILDFPWIISHGSWLHEQNFYSSKESAFNAGWRKINRSNQITTHYFKTRMLLTAAVSLACLEIR